MCNMLIYLFTMHNTPAPGTYLLLLFCPDTDAYLQIAYMCSRPITHVLSIMLKLTLLQHYGTWCFGVKSQVKSHSFIICTVTLGTSAIEMLCVIR